MNLLPDVMFASRCGVGTPDCKPRWLGGVGFAAALTFAPISALADPIVEPAVFSSLGGVLDVLMVARAQPVPTISFAPAGGGAPINPLGWVYEVCPRPPSGTQCPATATTVSDYGGVRLALQAGDVLKIRLVNRLPPLDNAKLKHGTEPGQTNLFRNPTNLHTHGMIVAPRTPTLVDPTFGDYVFVEVYNPANGMPEPQGQHDHGSVKMDFVDYKIHIPSKHPSGAFWFHPHVHGISLNQVASGLSGIISVGKVRDYVEDAPSVVRHLILKDMQVLSRRSHTKGLPEGIFQYAYGPTTILNGEAQHPQVAVTDGEVQNQQVGDFCEQRDNGGPNTRHGFCEGEPTGPGNNNSFLGSRWYFTINGQVFPTIQMASPNGEIWRLTNASAQVSYQLNLVDDSTGKVMPLQLLAIDGVSVAVPSGTSADTLMAVGGNKFTAVDCPSGGASVAPVCVRDLVMMPSARAEVWVAYRDANGAVVASPPGATATLKQGHLNLGRAAESWPEVKLAKIEFAQQVPAKHAVGVVSNATPSSSVMSALASAVAHPAAATACKPLAKGHRRRIFFGMVNPSNSDGPFGFGYEETIHTDGADPEDDAVVPGTRVAVSAYDPDSPTICLPLGPGGSEVHETWELVNLATETHNFHIHQTKFRVLGGSATVQMPNNASSDAGTAIIMEDNVPVPFVDAGNIPDVDQSQNGYCTIEQWGTGRGNASQHNSKKCIAPPIVLDVPFSQLGEFVFHCHILDHEDSGMMAKIKVVPGP